MTTDAPPGHRLRARRLWLLVALVAAAAAVVVVAVAAGLLGRSTTPEAGRAPAPPEVQPAIPSAVPSAEAPSTVHPSTKARTASPPTPTKRARVVVADNPAPPMSRSVPTRLLIPSIGVDSDLMSLGLKRDGTLETPPGAFPAGWFTGAPTPGQLGPAIIVGHVRYNTPGVFAQLSRLRTGDLVKVDRADGSAASFRVSQVEHFAKSAFPTQKVYGDLDHAGLRLITCGGLDARTNEFDENVVVFADLVAS